MPDAPPRPEPFTARTAPAVLADLRARPRATRWPDAPEDTGAPAFTADPAELTPEEHAWIQGIPASGQLT
jgi:hypothetical protein